MISTFFLTPWHGFLRIIYWIKERTWKTPRRLVVKNIVIFWIVSRIMKEIIHRPLNSQKRNTNNYLKKRCSWWYSWVQFLDCRYVQFYSRVDLNSHRNSKFIYKIVTVLCRHMFQTIKDFFVLIKVPIGGGSHQEEMWRNCTKTTSDFEGIKSRSISLFTRHSCRHNQTSSLTST